MRHKDENLYNILKEDAMIPSNVERAMQEAYTQLGSVETDHNSGTHATPKRGFRAAAAIAITALAIGTTAYAAANTSTIAAVQSTIWNTFSTFHREKLPEQAKSLIETEVAQEKYDNGIVTFTVRETLCDKNTIIAAVEVRAAEPEKYLIVPYYYSIQDEEMAKKMQMVSISPNSPEKKMKIADYLKKYNKEVLPVDAEIGPWESDSYSTFNLEEDGTAVFTCRIDNFSQEETMTLPCRTVVYNNGEAEINTFDFTINDHSDDMQTAIYHTEGDEPFEGTNVIIDELKFEKSSIDIRCTLTYHYIGNPEQVSEDERVEFFFFGQDGKELKNGPGLPGSSGPEGNGVFTQTQSLALIDLPDEVTLQARILYADERFGSIKLYRAD